MILAQLHVGEDLNAPGTCTAHLIAALSQSARVVCFDARGCGFSERSVTRYTLDAWVEDLQAVIDASGTEPVDLFVLTHAALIGIRYACVNPKRVRRLVIAGGYARGRMKRNPNAAQIKETQSQRAMIEVAWGSDLPYSASYRLGFMSRAYPQAGETLWQEMSRTSSRRWSVDVILGYTLATWDIDVSDEATRIICPTLVLHTSKGLFVPYEEGRRLAALIPGARFVTLESENHLPLESEPSWAVMRDEMRAFLESEGASAAEEPLPKAVGGLLTERQIQVLRAVSQGRTDKEIAQELGLSPRTVEMHMARVLSALHCPSRSAAVRMAVERRLLD